MTQHHECKLSRIECDPYRTPVDVTVATGHRSKPLPWIILAGVGIVAITCLIVVVVVIVFSTPVIQSDPQSISSATKESMVETEMVAETESIAPFIEQYGRTRGGAHILHDSGEVEFVVDRTVDSKELIAPPGQKNPYGLWGSLGTRNAAGETDQSGSD